VLGIVGFSGGLFLRVCLPQLHLGPIIPAGAMLWILSWLGLAGIAVLPAKIGSFGPENQPREASDAKSGKTESV
jgi:hypothetical protein